MRAAGWRANWLALATGVGLLVALAVFAGPPGPGGEPLDPASTAPDGTRALVEVYRSLGVQVDVSTDPQSATSTVILLRDLLDEGARDRLRDHVAQGGRLVVADPSSPLVTLPQTGRRAADLVGTTGVAPGCAEPALSEVTAVEAGQWVGFTPPAGALACFPVAGGAWLVATTDGAGELVVLGGADAFTNRRLGRADNALLALALVGEGPVTIVPRPPPGAGTTSLVDLVPLRVWHALAALGLAAVTVAVWRGRRLGAPVDEPLPVRIPGSELALALGDLLQRGGHRDRAARLLRADVRAELARATGSDPTLAPADLAAVVAARTGGDPGTITALLGPYPVADDAALARLARALADLRRAVRAPAGRLGAGR